MAGWKPAPPRRREMDELFRRRRLPHWDLPRATYFVTTCLAGSIPAQGLLDIGCYRAAVEARSKPDNWAEQQWAIHKSKLIFARYDQWLDHRPAARHLSDERLASRVVETIYHFAGVRYDLLGYVVMPSHIHWVFRPRDVWIATLDQTQDRRTPRERIMHSLKLYTARECNRILGSQGAFWQDESYDHCVRDEDELSRILNYVERNPVAAGLTNSPENWAFSSAIDRKAGGVHFGEPLTRGAGL